jgi:hypothetical protein
MVSIGRGHISEHGYLLMGLPSVRFVGLKMLTQGAGINFIWIFWEKVQFGMQENATMQSILEIRCLHNNSPFTLQTLEKHNNFFKTKPLLFNNLKFLGTRILFNNLNSVNPLV